jgi:hypothetical protein
MGAQISSAPLPVLAPACNRAATDYDFNDEILVPGASYIATLIEEMLDGDRKV